MSDRLQPGTQVPIDSIGIKLANVSFEIDQVCLIQNISCNLSGANITVVMGPNGAGKSLFLRLIAGLLQPTNGIIEYLPALDSKSDEPAIAMLFQQPILLRRTTAQNIEYVLHRYQYPKNEVDQYLRKALEDARLEHRASISARLLSGGEQQRLALARALVVKPKILLLDEVTSSLDPASVHIVENMINQASNTGTKTLFITHDVRQAKRIADDIVFIHEGKVMAHKSASEFFRDPGSQEAQAYLDGRIPGQN